MPRIAIFNLLFGFLAIFLSVCAGFFVAFDAEKAFLINKEILSSWQFVLMKSAHGHLSLYGFLHITTGLSLPYSELSHRWKFAQTLGLSLGTFAMGALMFLRSLQGASEGGVLANAIGIFLACSLGSLLLHCYGLGRKLMR